MLPRRLCISSQSRTPQPHACALIYGSHYVDYARLPKFGRCLRELETIASFCNTVVSMIIPSNGISKVYRPLTARLDPNRAKLQLAKGIEAHASFGKVFAFPSHVTHRPVGG